MKKNLTPTQKLDKLLNLLSKNLDAQKAPLNSDEIRSRIDFDIEDRELYLALQKLLKDGYVDGKTVDQKVRNLQGAIINGPVTRYSISFDGNLLCETGGYVQMLTDKEHDRRIARRNEKCLAWGSIIAAIATTGLFLYEIRCLF